MTINWQEQLDRVEEATKPLTLGEHMFRVVEAKCKPASTGNILIALVLKIEGGPDDGKLGYNNLVFATDNPRAMKMTLKRLNSFGITQETLRAENLQPEQIAARLIGRAARGTVTHRPWNNETQSDIDFLGGSPSGVPDAPSVPKPTDMPAAAIPTAAPIPTSAPTSVPTAATVETTPPTPAAVPAAAPVEAPAADPVAVDETAF